MQLNTVKLNDLMNYNVYDCAMPVIKGPEDEDDVRLHTPPQEWAPQTTNDYFLLWTVALSELYVKELEKRNKSGTRRTSKKLKGLKSLLFKLNNHHILDEKETEEMDKYVTEYVNNFTPKGE